MLLYDKNHLFIQGVVFIKTLLMIFLIGPNYSAATDDAESSDGSTHPIFPSVRR